MGVRTDPDTRPEHGTDETRRSTFDFTDDLLDGETISSVGAGNIAMTPSGLTLDNHTFSGGLVHVYTKGGTAGETYKIVVKATTSLGQVLQRGGHVYADVA